MDWLGLASIIGNVIDKVLPDKAAADKAKAELLKINLENEFKNSQMQVEVNKSEAEHSSLFVAGWRPFIGWVCGISFLYHFILVPTVAFFGGIPLPTYNMDVLVYVLGGLLGLGGMRSYEKTKGVARERIK